MTAIDELIKWLNNVVGQEGGSEEAWILWKRILAKARELRREKNRRNKK